VGQPADHALFLAAPVSLVHLHCPVQSVPAWPHHGSPQLMQHGPCGLVTAQPQRSLQPKSTDSVLLAGNVPHSPEPSGQRKMTFLKKRPGSYRRLMAAVSTKPQPPTHRPSSLSSTLRADKALDPAQGKQVPPTGFFVNEPSFHFQERAGIIFDHHRQYYRLG
jgi:hypothetical protein